MRPRAWLIALALMLALAVPAAAQDQEALYQVSLLDALLAGDYEGSVKVGELLRHGDLGLGTFDALDGEMVVNAGVAYRVDPQGVPQPVPPTATTPFAQVTFFSPDLTFPAPKGLDFAGLQKWLATRLPSPNYVYAVRLTGVFDRVKARTVLRQVKPYPPLVKACETQVVFEWKNLQGELVGFISPGYMKGIGAPGWHLHFLGAAKRRAGHLLEVTIREALVEVDLTPRFLLVLPESKEFMQMDFARDRGQALKVVEQGK